MRAAFYNRLGQPGETVEIGEVEAPAPGPGQVRVRIHVSAINPSDVKRATGWSGAPMAGEFQIPNNDGAGVIDAIGEGVPATRLGQRVWVYEATLTGQKQGTAAEFCVVPADYALELSDKADFDFGACLGVPAMTAHRCVFADGPVQGKTVLVAGGAGSVGRFAVQFAKWGGAQVIATAGSDRTMEIARKAGADVVLGYRSPTLADDILAAAAGTPSGGVDRIVEVHFRDNIGLDAQVLKTNGYVAIYGSSDDPDEAPQVPMRDLLRKGITLRWVMVYALDKAQREAGILDIGRAIADGAITPEVAGRYRLDQTAQAMEAVGVAGLGGKILLDVAG